MLTISNLVVRASQCSDRLWRSDRSGSTALITLISQGPLAGVAVRARGVWRVERVAWRDLVVLHEHILVRRASIRHRSHFSFAAVASRELVLGGLTREAVGASDEGSNSAGSRHLGGLL